MAAKTFKVKLVKSPIGAKSNHVAHALEAHALHSGNLIGLGTDRRLDQFNFERLGSHD